MDHFFITNFSMVVVLSIVLIVPSILMTLWTTVVICAVYLLTIKTRLPPPIAYHALVMIYNPKDEHLYRRPSILVSFIFLMMSLIPVVSLLFCIFQMYIGYIYPDTEQRIRKSQAKHDAKKIPH